jgi:hypothetical protein
MVKSNDLYILQTYWKKEGITPPAPEIIQVAAPAAKKRKKAQEESLDAKDTPGKKKKARKLKEYCPVYKSGGHGLLMGLLDGIQFF